MELFSSPSERVLALLFSTDCESLLMAVFSGETLVSALRLLRVPSRIPACAGALAMMAAPKARTAVVRVLRFIMIWLTAVVVDSHRRRRVLETRVGEPARPLGARLRQWSDCQVGRECHGSAFEPVSVEALSVVSVGDVVPVLVAPMAQAQAHR